MLPVKAIGIDLGLRVMGGARVAWDGTNFTVEEAAVADTSRMKFAKNTRKSVCVLEKTLFLWRFIDEFWSPAVQVLGYEVYTPFKGRASGGTKVAMTGGLVIGYAISKELDIVPVLPLDLKQIATGTTKGNKKDVEQGLIDKSKGLDDQLSRIARTKREHAADAAGIAMVALRSYFKVQETSE